MEVTEQDMLDRDSGLELRSPLIPCVHIIAFEGGEKHLKKLLYVGGSWFDRPSRGQYHVNMVKEEPGYEDMPDLEPIIITT